MEREAAEKLEAAAAEARREKEKLANEEKQERVRIAAEARDEAAKAAAEAKLLDDRMALELRTATQVTIVCVGGGGRPAMEGLPSAMSSVHFDIRNGASVAAVIEGVGLPGVELKETDVAAALGAYASAKHRRTLLSCSPFAARPEEFGGTSRLSAYSPNMTYSVGGVRWRRSGDNLLECVYVKQRSAYGSSAIQYPDRFREVGQTFGQSPRRLVLGGSGYFAELVRGGRGPHGCVVG